MQKKFEDIITESRTYKSKKVEEAYDPSIPDWLKGGRSGSKMQDFKGTFDLSNAQYIPLNKDEFTNTDPIWKDSDYIKIFNTPEGVYATDGTRDYIGKYQDIYYGTDKNGKYRQKRFSNTSRKNLIDMATDIGYIKKSDVEDSDTNARKYGRYKDPRTDNRGNYVGQKYSDYSDTWLTGNGRDKSGYKIIDPKNMMARYYNVEGIEDVQKVLDRYYNKLIEIRDEIISLDFRKFNDNSFGMGASLYHYFQGAIEDYNHLANKCEEKIKRIAKNGIPEYYDSFADYFNSEDSDITYWKKELSDEILTLKSNLKKTKENMNESKLNESYLAADEKVYSFQLDVVVPSNIDAEFEFPAKLQRVLNNRGYEVLSATMLDDITDWYEDYFKGE